MPRVADPGSARARETKEKRVCFDRVVAATGDKKYENIGRSAIIARRGRESDAYSREFSRH